MGINLLPSNTIPARSNGGSDWEGGRGERRGGEERGGEGEERRGKGRGGEGKAIGKHSEDQLVIKEQYLNLFKCKRST